jgi:hypothetical protein
MDQWGLLVPDERQTANDSERRSYYRLTGLGERVLFDEAEFLANMAADTLAKRSSHAAEAV